VSQEAPAINGLGPPSPPTLEDLGKALTRFLASGAEADRGQVRGLTAALAEQGLGPAACAGVVWEKVRRALLSSTDEDRPWLLDRAIAAQHELWCLFERAYELERRAHRQMSAAYARRNLEIDHILDNLPASAFAKDAQSRYTAVNATFCEGLGLSRERILSRTDADLFPAEIAAELLSRDRQVIEGREPSRQEATTLINGEPRTFLITKSPLFESQGLATGLVGVAVDITARKKIEEHRLGLVAALESAHDAIFIMDSAGIIEYVNPAFEHLTQFASDEAIGQGDTIIKSDSQDDTHHDRMWRQLTDGKAWRGVAPMRRKDSSEFQSEQNIAPVRDETGVITGYVSVARDVSEHKRVMEALQDAVMIKSDFTSMVSHELRTPPCAIKEAVDVVADGSAGPTNDHQAQFLGLAKRNVGRLHRLINDVLDFSRLERGGAATNIEPHPLNKLVAAELDRQRVAAERRGIELTQDLGEGIGDVPLDEQRIGRLLSNLLSNAIRYCDGPLVKVSTLASADEVIVTVRDNGPGIAPEYLETIVDPFVRLSSGLGRQVGATGLGLAICRQIIELHGGRIWAESKPGEGSAFSFALPLGPKEENTSP